MASEKKTNINWFPGHMRKALNRISEQLKYVDFVVELLDSRAPMACVNSYVEKIIQNKPKLYILTKTDLSEEIETKKWVDYFISEGNKCIACNLTRKDDFKQVLEKIAEFCREKLQKVEKKGIKKVITRGIIIGIPNVGKSTLINYVANKKITQIANRPGLTRNIRWVKINDFELMDTPGILEPQYDDKDKAVKLAMLGSIKFDVLPMDELVDILIDYLLEHHKDEFFVRYKIENYTNNIELLESIAKSRGFIEKSGVPNLDKARTMLLNEFRNGVISKISLERVENA